MNDNQTRGRALVVLVLAVLVVFASLGLGRFGFTMVLPAMQKGLGLTNTQSGQLQSWNSLGYLLLAVGSGILATRYGPSVVITCALGVVGLAMLATGAFPTFTGACVGRFFSGAGGAAANIPAMALLCAWFTGKRRGLAAGCAVGGSSLGLAATGAAVPWLLQRGGAEGWQHCWYAFGVVTLVICALCAAFLRDRPAPAAIPASADASASRKPVMLRSTVLWRIATAYFAFGFSYSIFATFFVNHLKRDIGLSIAQAGTIWTRIGLASVISGFVWGAFSDRWGRRLALVVIYLCQGSAFLIVGLSHGLGGALFAGFLFACTAWSIPAVISALCGDVFGAKMAPAALGVVTVVFGVGQVLGPAVGGIVADSTGSFAPAFAVAGAAAWLLGAGVSAFLPGRVASRGE
ncbi:MAG: YbfB/YjiJ family MFS transporter [Victivallales bacterium]|nr:YbfB/YjiJ family MFS transporter [Victivallales bacterium]